VKLCVYQVTPLRVEAVGPNRTQTLACGLIQLDTRGDLPMDVNARGLFYRAVASAIGIRGVAIARAGFVPTHIGRDGIAHGPATQTVKWNEPPVPNPIICEIPDGSFRPVRVGAGDYETGQYPSEARGKEIDAQGGRWRRERGEPKSTRSRKPSTAVEG
jgi:hypothetical protein